MMKALVAGIVIALAIPAALEAQRGEDTLPHGHVLPALGLRVGEPQKASAALGVVLGDDWQKNGREHSRNVALFAEPGLGAGRVSLAYIRRGYGSFGSGYALSATVLRTWKNPWTVQPNVTYMGGEVVLWPILFVGPRVGVLHSVSGALTDKHWLVSFDIGIGL
jgi:hypothetical protein